ncbi:MAG: penicillin-binding protein beta-lactamase class, partial [Frankiales bacterium]|nr:penicillin-binding protein beta-lactamase class [Frankiales bacterium]
MPLDPAAVATLLAFADEQVDNGRIPSCTLALALDGEVVVRHAAGTTEDARYVVFSVTKAITAAVTWLYLGQGLEPTTRVRDVLPEFTGDGRERVSLSNLL